MHLFISTGEVSGEQHASNLIKSLKSQSPDIRITAMGGDIMRDAGAEIIVDNSDNAVMGLVEVIKHLPSLKKAFDNSLAHIGETRPDAVVLIDYPGFHLRLARAVKKKYPDIPVIYYIAPKVWAWNEARVVKIREAVDLLLCIFSFEEGYFAGHGVNAKFAGNPTMDAVRNLGDGGALREELGVGAGEKLVSIFPGSRRKELEHILAPLMEAASILSEHDENLRFAISAAPGFSRVDMDKYCEIPQSIKIVEGRSHELIAASDLLLAKSGTTTLEAALIGRPMVVVYRSSWITAAIARRVMRIPWFSLPNIVAGKEIVTELAQEEVTGLRISSEAMRILDNPDIERAMLDEFALLRKGFGDEPAGERAARAIFSFLDK